jgi:hypothetical protein
MENKPYETKHILYVSKETYNYLKQYGESYIFEQMDIRIIEEVK